MYQSYRVAMALPNFYSTYSVQFHQVKKLKTTHEQHIVLIVESFEIQMLAAMLFFRLQPVKLKKVI